MPPHLPRPCRAIILPSFSDLEDLQDRIPAHLQFDPLLSFTEFSDSTDFATAHACLRLCTSRLHNQAENREDPRDQLVESQAGVKALSWYLETGQHEKAESIDVGLIAAMALCIVVEGLTSVWWELMKSEHVVQSFGAKANRNREFIRVMAHRWHNCLLRGLVEAQAYWTTETNMFNETLNTFFTASRYSKLRIPVSGA